MKEKIERVVMTTIPVKNCNLRCEYCLNIQLDIMGSEEKLLPLSVIKEGCSRERTGTCLFNISGTGETLLAPYLPDLLEIILKEGHYACVITNGTLTEKMRAIAEKCKTIGCRDKFYYIISLHYCELKRLNLLKKFRDNIKWLQQNGVLFYVTMVLYDSYIDIIDEIKAYCADMDVVPVFTAAKDYAKDKQLLTRYSEEDYLRIGREIGGKFFEAEEIAYKQRKREFCYGGERLFLLDLAKGEARQCSENYEKRMAFFENVEGKPTFLAVGHRCKAPYCYCGFRENMHMAPACDFLWEDEVLDAEPELHWMGELKELVHFDFTKNAPLLNENEIEQKNYKLEMEVKVCDLIDKLFEEKNYAEVIKYSQKLLENQMDVWDLHTARLLTKYGYALLELCEGGQENVLKAVLNYKELSYSGDYCTMVGNIYARMERFDMAEEWLEKAVDAYAKYGHERECGVPYYCLGIIHESVGDKKQGLLYYQKAEKCGYAPAEDRIRTIEKKI